MKAALDAGAEFMFAPFDNCDEIVGHVPAGLQVVAVKNIDDALAALEQLRTENKPPTKTELGCPTR
jgi:PDZ domain-containing protein